MKYARVERERRFVLRGPPVDLPPGYRRIVDRYVAGTRLRLRRVEDEQGRTVALKLAQKHAAEDDPTAATITNLYLDEFEYGALCALGGDELVKRRHRYEHHGRVWAVDVFEGRLAGLVLAECECDDGPAGDETTPRADPLPGDAVEVTDDAGFRGGALATASPVEVHARLRRLLES